MKFIMGYKMIWISAMVVLLGTHVTALAENDTHVYAWTFMDVVTAVADANMAQYQDIHYGVSHDTDFRLQMLVIGLDLYGSLHSNSILQPQFAELVWLDDLSHDHDETETSFHSMRMVANHAVDISGTKATRGSTDAFLALPLTFESTEFFIPSYTNIPQGHSSFLIVSAYKDTCVEAAYVNGNDVRRIFFRSLREFEVYQTYAKDQDYTGVYVNSTRPVSVIAGHECGQVPVSVVFCDHMVSQIPPISEWGNEFLIGPIAGRNQNAGYVIRVVAGFQDTEVTATDENSVLLTSTILQRGNFVEIVVTNSLVSVYIWTSENALVTQYNTGYFAATGINNDVPTDPFMMVITPISHFINHVTFSTTEYWSPTGLQPFSSYLTIIARTVAKNNIRLNNNDLNTMTSGASWVDNVVATGYSIIAFPLEHGNYTLYHLDENQKIVGYIYGHSNGDPTGYGYGIGYDMQGSPLPGDWWDLILADAPEQPAEECVTLRVPPTVELRGPFQQFTIRGILRNKAISSDCLEKYQAVIGPKLADLKLQINKLICEEQLCPNTVYTHITRLNVALYSPSNSGSELNSFDINVEMVTSIDETIGDLVICRRQVIAFLLEVYNWEVPIAVTNCPEFDLGDVILQGQMYQCLAPQ